MEPDVILLALVCGHVLGDFVFQTNGLADSKERRQSWLLLHVLLVGMITWILLGSAGFWWVAVILAVSHLGVDTAKRAICRRSPGRGLLWFGLDQTLHLGLLILLWFALRTFVPTTLPANGWVTVFGPDYARGLTLLSGLSAGVWGVGILMKHQMAGFASALDDSVRQGLPGGGRTIGMLERFLAFVFVLSGNPAGVGFVIAAKSVFRIGELTNQKDRDHAEYIMIGTLWSFAYALTIAFLTSWLLGRIR